MLTTPLPTRALLLITCAVFGAACAAPPPEPLLPSPPEPVAGNLGPDDRDALRSLGIPVLVPGDVGAFRLAAVQVEAGAEPLYSLRYRRTDGACFEVTGASGGFGSPGYPIVSTDVRIRALGRTVRLYEAARDEGATSAQAWGPGTVVSEPFDLDGAGAFFLSNDEDGCRPVTLQEGARIVSDLRLLAAGPARPPADAAGLGAFADAPDLLAGYNAASAPDVAADALARRYDGEADRVTVDVLRRSDAEATALVTAFGLRDDSIRDERLLLTYAPFDGQWELVAAGRQVRCQSGRGHADWSDRACR